MFRYLNTLRYKLDIARSTPGPASIRKVNTKAGALLSNKPAFYICMAGASVEKRGALGASVIVASSPFIRSKGFSPLVIFSRLAAHCRGSPLWQIYDFIMYVLENGVTEELYPGDERRIFGETLAALTLALYSTMNDSAKQATLRYARGEVLDALGEFAGVYRIEAMPATTALRFSLKEAVNQNIIIPKGTRATSDYTRYFATTETAVLQAGSLYVDIEAESTEGGSNYNEIPEGEINVLVDLIPYIDAVSNTAETTGGGDVEIDEDLRQRIRLSPSGKSTAGPKNAYRYFAISADSSVADAHVDSPSPGVVVITPILYGGGIPLLHDRPQSGDCPRYPPGTK